MSKAAVRKRKSRVNKAVRDKERVCDREAKRTKAAACRQAPEASSVQVGESGGDEIGSQSSGRAGGSRSGQAGGTSSAQARSSSSASTRRRERPVQLQHITISTPVMDVGEADGVYNVQSEFVITVKRKMVHLKKRSQPDNAAQGFVRHHNGEVTRSAAPPSKRPPLNEYTKLLLKIIFFTLTCSSGIHILSISYKFSAPSIWS